MATKAREAFRTISEVANWLDVPAHVLRFWESKFSQIKPVKRAGGRRYYRPSDMELIGGIKKLLHDDGLTIRGVQKMLKEEGVKKIAALSPPIETISDQEAAERRAARRARRAAKRAAKQSPENAQIEDAQTIVPDGKRDAEVVELSSVQAQKADSDDNVVPLTRREQRRASLEEQAAQLDKEQIEAVQEEQTTEVDAPELDFGAPRPAPEDAPTEEATNEAAPETPDEEPPQLEDRAPLEDAQVSETSPPEIAPGAEGAGEPDELEPAAEATAELSEVTPEPEAKIEVPEAPEPEDIEISETKIAKLATTQALRERDELDPAERDRAKELYERLAVLRERIVQNSEQP